MDLVYTLLLHSSQKINHVFSSSSGLKPQVCRRFQSSAYRSNQWRYRGRCDAIQVKIRYQTR